MVASEFECVSNSQSLKMLLSGPVTPTRPSWRRSQEPGGAGWFEHSVTPTNQHGQSFLARVKVKSEKRSRSSPGYWIFPGQKRETKEVKNQAGAGVKGGTCRRSKREGAGTCPSWAVQTYTFTQGLTA